MIQRMDRPNSPERWELSTFRSVWEAFKLVGLGEEDVKAKFPAMYNAFTYGAPPHAGIAPGVDRMVMLPNDCMV